jgi:hypothetical protein
VAQTSPGMPLAGKGLNHCAAIKSAKTIRGKGHSLLHDHDRSFAKSMQLRWSNIPAARSH